MSRLRVYRGMNGSAEQQVLLYARVVFAGKTTHSPGVEWSPDQS